MNDTQDKNFWMTARTINKNYEFDRISIDHRNRQIANLIGRYFDEDDLIEDMSNRLGIDPDDVDGYNKHYDEDDNTNNFINWNS